MLKIPARILSGSRRVRLVAIVAVVLTLGSSALYVLMRAPASVRPPTPLPTVPVDTAVVARSDVPTYLDGLGTVQAFNTVTVTTQVDGQLLTINFVEGQDVKKGAVLAQLDSRIYRAAFNQAVATKEKDEAQLANARLDLQRYSMLAPQNYTSKQTLDTQRALVAQLQAQVKIDQAIADAAATNLDYTTIKAPIDGRTGIRLVDAGNNVLTTANTSLVVITQLHPISVIFSLTDENLPNLAKAIAGGPLTVLALSRDEKTELDRGNLSVIDNQILQATGTIRLKATFPNAKNTLWPGQFVNSRLFVETQQKVLTIPSTAVQRGPNGQYAYVVRSDSTVEMRPLKLGRVDSSQAIIEDGLRPGELVVTAGQYRLQPGTRIQMPSSNVQSAASEPIAVDGTP